MRSSAVSRSPKTWKLRRQPRATVRRRRRCGRCNSRTRTLDSADPGQRAVEAVAQPLHDEQPAGDPEPGEVVVGELIGDADADRAEDADHGEVIGEDPARQPGGDPAQQPALRNRGEEAGLALRFDCLAQVGHGDT
jgi:hypothetical protein